MRLIAALCLLSPLAIGIFAQTSASTQPAPVYKTTVRQVVLDVVVTGAKGEALPGLKKEDFSLLEDGKPQTISYFQEHTGAAPAQGTAALPAMPPNVYTNFPLTQETDSVSVLLLDALNTPMPDQAYVRQQMLKYLKQLPPGTRIAVFTLASRLRMVQGFTSESSQLLAALDGKKHKLLPQSSPLLDTDHTQEDFIEQLQNDPAMSNSLALSAMQQFNADTQTFRTDMRVRITLDALSELGRYLSSIPGRKNLLWFSGSFPFIINPDLDLPNPFQAMSVYGDQIRETTDMLRLGQIAVYPIDARGLMVSPVYDASRRGPFNAAAFAKAGMKFFQQTAAEHQTMNTIAEETGGEAIYNTNGIQDAIRRVINNGSHYYTLAYTPTSPKLDGGYRHIQVLLARSGYNLQYRHGYFAEDPEAAHKHTTTAPSDPFLPLMAHGLPSFSQIIYKVMMAPENPQPSAMGPVVGDNKTLKGGLVRYQMDYAVAEPTLSFSTTPDGLHHGTVRFAAVAFDQNGNVLNSTVQEVQLHLKPGTYSAFSQVGLQFRQELDLPKNAVFLRTGVYDPLSGRIGTLEVPVQVTVLSSADK